MTTPEAPTPDEIWIDNIGDDGHAVFFGKKPDWYYPGAPHYLRATPTRLAAEAMREALAKISGERVGNLLRFEGEDDTDYFLRCIRAIKDEARAALSLAQGGEG